MAPTCLVERRKRHGRDRPEPQNDLIYDLDWHEEECLAEWQDVVARTRDLPVVPRAADICSPWHRIGAGFNRQ
ncbi:DUF1612 domain-containing protein [Mesorhizobium sp. M0955]|uniref:DUF1612 domain-containing protein n=1 Tax=Mesorhizobium sp. M0955 TaxID=2957033 RepID=UPI00333D0F06